MVEIGVNVFKCKVNFLFWVLYCFIFGLIIVKKFNFYFSFNLRWYKNYIEIFFWIKLVW